jgi:O-acetyl-ADP-ribose deacetylase (regulator of RNase III)
MKPIVFSVGDTTKPLGDGPKIIAHICNDEGSWGRGFVLALSKRYPEPEKAFRAWAKSGNSFGLGAVQFVGLDDEVEVANLVGQHRISRKTDAAGAIPPVRYEAIRQGLETIAKRALDTGASVHMPRIGCGLGGGKWEIIAPIIEAALCAREIEVFVYDLAA